MRKQQDIQIILHYPKAFDLHKTVRHMVAVWELIELDMAGNLNGPLDVKIRLLDEGTEGAALERYMKKQPPNRAKTRGSKLANTYLKKHSLRQSHL